MEYRPRGSFMNFLQGVDGAATSSFGPSLRPQHPAYQMHHFPMPYTHFMGPPPPPGNTHNSPMASDSRSPSPANIGQHQVTIDVEAADDDSRQRMYYTPEEDVSLVSAWINNSSDPIEGNSKKLARYWEEVAAAYNLKAPSDRKRTVKHLKNHWYKTTKKRPGKGRQKGEQLNKNKTGTYAETGEQPKRNKVDFMREEAYRRCGLRWPLPSYVWFATYAFHERF